MARVCHEVVCFHDLTWVNETRTLVVMYVLVVVSMARHDGATPSRDGYVASTVLSQGHPNRMGYAELLRVTRVTKGIFENKLISINTPTNR